MWYMFGLIGLFVPLQALILGPVFLICRYLGITLTIILCFSDVWNMVHVFRSSYFEICGLHIKTIYVLLQTSGLGPMFLVL